MLSSNCSEQLESERKKCRQHAFDILEMEKQLTILSRELWEARIELARRDLIDAFVSAPSPSTAMH